MEDGAKIAQVVFALVNPFTNKFYVKIHASLALPVDADIGKVNVELYGTCVYSHAIDKGVVVDPCGVGVEDSGVGEELELSGYERGAASGSLLLRAGHISAVRLALKDKEGGEEGGDDV